MPPSFSGHESERLDSNDASQNMGRRLIEEKLRKQIYVERFGGRAGAVLENAQIEQYGYSAYAQQDNIYAPFASELDWLVAKWAKMRGPGSTAFSELLNIPGVSALLFILIYLHIYMLYSCLNDLTSHIATQKH